MKKIISLLIVFMTIVATFTVKAERYFHSFTDRDGFDYTYISPEMVKAMSSKSLKTNDTRGFTYDFSFADLLEVEILTTRSMGTDSELWQRIRDLIKKEGLKSLTCTKEGYRRFDMIGKVDSSNCLTNLMLIVQNGGNNVSVTYLTGKIKLENMQGDF